MKPSYLKNKNKNENFQGFILADRQSFSEMNFYWALLGKKETFR